MKLLDICEAIVDCPHSTAKNDGTGYPLIRTPNVGKGRLKLAGVHRVSENVYNLRNERAVPQVDDLILAREAPVGNVAIIRQGQQVCLGQRTVLIRPNKECVDPDFLVYYLLSPKLQHNLLSSANGATVSHLNMSSIRSLEVQVPDIEVQKRIGAILARIDDKIELNTAINENLEQQAQALYKAWFVDFEPFGGVMPDDWSIGTISDLSSDIICGKTPSTKKKEYYGDYMPFITIPDMHNNVYVIATERSLSEMGSDSQSKKTLPANSICVSCIGTAGLVALVAVDSQTNQQINSIIPKERYSSYYIFLLMQTFSEKINRLGQSGSTIVNLNKAQFGLMEALVPSISDMNDFDTIVKPLFEQILANQYENQQLAALRDTLLPKLMNGEIDVSEVKI
jgi:type I restriction/modification specificity protein